MFDDPGKELKWLEDALLWRLVRSVNPIWCKIDRETCAAARRVSG